MTAAGPADAPLCCAVLPPAAGDNPDQSQIVCNGCRVLLSYPRGAQSVQCSLCQVVTQVRAEHLGRGSKATRHSTHLTWKALWKKQQQQQQGVGSCRHTHMHASAAPLIVWLGVHLCIVGNSVHAVCIRHKAAGTAANTVMMQPVTHVCVCVLVGTLCRCLFTATWGVEAAVSC